MKTNGIFLFSLLLAFGLLVSCAQAPQSISEKPLAPTVDLAPEKARDSTLRLVYWRGGAIDYASGFFVGTDKIATALHVVAHPGPVFAKLVDQETTWAVEKVLAFDVKNDLVVVKIVGEGIPLPVGDSGAVQLNEPVSVVGYHDAKYKITAGVIQRIRHFDKRITVKAERTKGNRGTPVLNGKGQVIGVIVEDSDDSHSYAVPSNVLKGLLAGPPQIESLVQWQKRGQIRAEVYYRKGTDKYKANNYKNAIVDFNKTIELNPGHVRAHRKRGYAKYQLEDYAGAIEDYTDAIELNPEGADLYKGRGGVKFKLGESKRNGGDTEEVQSLYQAAIDDYTYAIKLNPEDTDLYSNRGGVKFKLAKFDGGDTQKAQNLYQAAIDDCTHAIKIDPENAGAYNNRGFANATLGDIASERGESEKAQSLYQAGCTDYYKSIELKNPADADTPTAELASEKDRASTVRVMGWMDGFFSASGFFVSHDKIATNIHVVARSGPIFAKLADQETIWMITGVTAFDVENDLVILRIAGEGTPLPLGDSDAVQIGEPVVAVGYSGGTRYKRTEGTLHSIRNSDKWLQTTSNTSPGASGSPLLNSKGEVIGVHTRSGGSYTYASPSSALKALLATSAPLETLGQWRKREQIRSYVYLVHGTLQGNQGNYRKAIDAFDQSIQLNLEHTMAYYSRGLAKHQLEDYAGAIDDYTAALKQNPEIAYIYCHRGLAQHALGVYDSAIVDYTHAIERNFGGVAPYERRAKANRKLGKHAKAIADYTHIIKQNPKAAAIYKKRAKVKRKLGNHAEAIDDFNKAIELNPEDASAYKRRGNAKRKLGDYNGAVDDYTAAIKLNSGYVYAYYNRAATKHKLGDYVGAIDDYTRVIKIIPDHSDAYYNRGLAREAFGQYAAAKKDFEKANELDPDVGQ